MGTPAVTGHPPSTYEEALERASTLFGIEAEFWDIWGNHHRTPPEVRQSILRSLGVDASSREGLEAAIEERLWREWSRVVPPALVVSHEPQPLRIPVSLPAGAASAALAVEWEDGGRERMDFPAGSLAEVEHCQLRGRAFLRGVLELPFRAPLGYHTLTVTLLDGVSHACRLIVCPERAYLPERLAAGGRAAGLAVSLYGLRSERNWGCGDFTDLERLAAWSVERLGVSFIALNPLHALANRQPYNTSPYLPYCTFYKNLLYLDIERVPDFASSPLACRAARCRRVQEEVRALRASEFVEYERVQALKLRILRILFRAFLREWRAGTPRANEFRAYIEREGALLDHYAVYSALDEWLHAQDPDVWTWDRWPEPYRDPESVETREFARLHWRRVLFFKYVQWQLDAQLAETHRRAREKGMEIGLYHDLALATDRFASDLWSGRQFYVAGCRVGSPPDDFAPQGQDWGFPPPNSEAHYQDGYRVFAETIRKNSRHGGALRIDHVMRFFRLYWIPDGRSAAEGTYVRDRYQDLLRILALESVRGRFLVVGEDLGTVPDFVRDTLARFGILSYRLFYFERDAAGEFKPPEAYPTQALVAASTHDLPTLAGFWTCRDIEARRAAGLVDEAGYRAQLEARARDKQRVLDCLHRLKLLPADYPRQAAGLPEMTGEIHNALVGFLAASPSMLMLINEEDLTKEPDQQNLPGSTHQYPNWRRKTLFRIEDFESCPKVEDYARMFRHWLARTGRTNVARG